MNGTATPAGQVLYFGKLPSRGDFVRSSAGSALIHGIDQWMSQTMELLAQDPRWKLVYDAASPVHFAILGVKSHAGLAGHLAASHDASGRRFPFVMAASFEVPEPAGFVPYSPLALGPLWQRLDQGMRQALEAADFGEVQDRLTAQPVGLEVRREVLQASYRNIVQNWTLADFEQAVSPAGAALSFRQTALALGMLLQPVLSQGHGGMSKGLVLPLPRDPLQLTGALALWVDLVARFFRRTTAEIALFVTRHRQDPVLVMGFRGASAATLRSVLDADLSPGEHVVVSEAQWVEDWIDGDYGLRKFSNYLRDPSLSLAVAVDVFRETFLGD